MMFKDKVVIISGIGPGMGVELARIAAREGAKVAISSRTQPFLEKTAEAISHDGGEVIWRRVDISKNEDCQAFAKMVTDKWGHIDALVNNAASIGGFSTFEEADFENWRATVNINLFGSLQMAQACVPQMKKQGKGYIVNVSSMAHKKTTACPGRLWHFQGRVGGRNQIHGARARQIWNPGELRAHGLDVRAAGDRFLRGAGQGGRRRSQSGAAAHRAEHRAR
jgi:NAD(P)-dependent dehydrogenase (short-subunit alcohol dehydrogenase family)